MQLELREKIENNLQNTVDAVVFDGEMQKHQGKVRDSFIFEKKRVIVATDRISAFDFPLGTIPFKGMVLNQVAAWWFDVLSQEKWVNHHFIASPHPNVSVVRNATVIPLEIIVRAYLTGSTTTSAWYAYRHLDRVVSGVEMPSGMRKNQKFALPILTPTTKAADGHDEPISANEILQQGILKPFAQLAGKSESELWRAIEETAQRIFRIGQTVADERGLILVDTKYEFGIDENGKLMLVDEVHTPDSSRYWIASSYDCKFAAAEEPDSLDKEFVRRMLVESGFDVHSSTDPKTLMTDEIKIQASMRYIRLFSSITGQQLELREFVKDDLKSAIRAVATI